MPIHVLHRTDGNEITAFWAGLLGGIFVMIFMTVIENRRDIAS